MLKRKLLLSAYLLCCSLFLTAFFFGSDFAGNWVAESGKEYAEIKKDAQGRYAVTANFFLSSGKRVELSKSGAEKLGNLFEDKYLKFEIDKSAYKVTIKKDTLIVMEGDTVVFKGKKSSPKDFFEAKKKYENPRIMKDDMITNHKYGLLEEYIDRYKIVDNSVKYNGNYYTLFPKLSSMEKARTFCQEHQGDLAVIDNAELNDVLYALLSLNGYVTAYFNGRKNKYGEYMSFDDTLLSYRRTTEKSSDGDFARLRRSDTTWRFWNFSKDNRNINHAFICRSQEKIDSTYFDQFKSYRDLTENIPDDIYGTYSGVVYEKLPGLGSSHPGVKFAFVLKVFKDEANRPKAVWHRADIRGDIKTPLYITESFQMDVTQYKEGKYVFIGKKWLKRPRQCSFTNFTMEKQGNIVSGYFLGELSSFTFTALKNGQVK